MHGKLLAIENIYIIVVEIKCQIVFAVIMNEMTHLLYILVV